ncbi:MAG: PDZ domain-containing protein, partial [Calditrichae bacterium]|nr:PDZ domain-containing protein [Calditrichia bacterium]
MMDAAINGVLTSLDPHTVYLNPAHFHRFTAIMDGTAYGIGIAFEIIEGLPTVISVVPGGPAANKNIHTGDILVKVNDEFVSNKTEPELRLLLSGDKGSEVKLTLKKFLNEEEFAVHIERDEIPLRSINYYFLLKSIFGYVKIDQFSKTVPDELENVLTKLDKMGMACLILDLRGNAGGSLQSAVNLVDMFIAEGKLIMSTKGRKADANETYYASDEDKQPDYPMIVLIDRGSASASEIVAGALQEHDRALIVGTNSFGKGLVQGTFLLENGGAILMTIARYYTPTGRLIQRE